MWEFQSLPKGPWLSWPANLPEPSTRQLDGIAKQVAPGRRLVVNGLECNSVRKLAVEQWVAVYGRDTPPTPAK